MLSRSEEAWFFSRKGIIRFREKSFASQNLFREEMSFGGLTFLVLSVVLTDKKAKGFAKLGRPRRK